MEHIDAYTDLGDSMSAECAELLLEQLVVGLKKPSVVTDVSIGNQIQKQVWTRNDCSNFVHKGARYLGPFVCACEFWL